MCHYVSHEKRKKDLMGKKRESGNLGFRVQEEKNWSTMSQPIFSLSSKQDF